MFTFIAGFSRNFRPFSLLSLLIVASCGDDDGSGPEDDDGNREPVLLISSENPSDWEAKGSSPGEPPICLLEDGVFQTAGELPEQCHFFSVQTIDFTPYASARLQCHIERPSMYDAVAVRVYNDFNDLFIVHLAYNSPGPPDSLVDLPIDLSFIEEVTVRVDLTAWTSTGARPTVADLRVVGMPR